MTSNSVGSHPLYALRGSNPGPSEKESIALPTEQRTHSAFKEERCFLFASAKVLLITQTTKNSRHFFINSSIYSYFTCTMENILYPYTLYNIIWAAEHLKMDLVVRPLPKSGGHA